MFDGSREQSRFGDDIAGKYFNTAAEWQVCRIRPFLNSLWTFMIVIDSYSFLAGYSQGGVGWKDY